MERTFVFHDPDVVSYIDNHPAFNLEEVIRVLIKNFPQIQHSNDTNFLEMFQHLKESLCQQLDRNSSHMLSHLDSFDTKRTENIVSSIETVNQNVLSFTNSLQNSSRKGAISENRLELLLPQVFPHFTILSTHNLAASGDFIIEHPICGNIMLENKDYKDNINKLEIDKFLRDVSKLKCHGILMSQNTGICNKTHLQIEFHQGCVVVYLHKVHYSSDILLDAINIIQSTKDFAASLHNSETDSSSEQEGVVVSDEQLNALYNEWKSLHDTHNDVVNGLKNHIKSLQSQFLPTLEQFLKLRFPSMVCTVPTCVRCGRIFKSNAGLTSHYRQCN